MNGKRFRPGMVMSIVVVIMLIILLSLGTWQMDRSREKQLLLDSYQQAPSLPSLDFAAIGDDWEQYRFRKIDLDGKYDTQHQVLLENQVRSGQSGFMVFTPFHVDDGQQTVLVNRGWLPRHNDPGSLPDVTVTEQKRSLIGLISHPPEVGFRIGSLNESASGWPKMAPYIDHDWISLQLGEQIVPWVVLLDKGQSDGFLRDWHPSVRMTPDKHKGYAFQWYSLAIVLVFLFVVGSLKPEGREDARHKDEQE
jgi:surfeit locus 1 family protein